MLKRGKQDTDNRSGHGRGSSSASAARMTWCEMLSVRHNGWDRSAMRFHAIGCASTEEEGSEVP